MCGRSDWFWLSCLSEDLYFLATIVGWFLVLAAHQIELIIDTIGYPTDSEIAKIPNKKAREFIRSLQPTDKSSKLSKKLDEASPMAIDLVSKMLKFDPEKRITVEAAL